MSTHIAIGGRLGSARWVSVVIALIGAALTFAVWYMPDF